MQFLTRFCIAALTCLPAFGLSCKPKLEFHSGPVAIADMKFDDPESRVRAFITDYHLQWQAAQKYMGDFRAMNFEAIEQWAMECESLDRRHYAADAVPANTDDSYSSPPSHHAEQEQITKTQSDGETAVVQTRQTGDLRTTYEYHLKRVGDDWRLTKLSTLFGEEGKKLFTDVEKQNLLTLVKANARLPDLPLGVEPNCDRLFQVGRAVPQESKNAKIVVQSAGKLRIASGSIGVYDLGWDGSNFLPMSRRVPVGEHSVDVAVAEAAHPRGGVYGTTCAVRVLFQPNAEVARWVPAETVRWPKTNHDPSHYVGVDSGMVTLADADAMMSLEEQNQERHYEAMVPRDVVKGASARYWTTHLASTPDQAPDCLCVHSGHGDGAYPSYWGLAADGSIVSLVVDFLVLAEFHSETISIPWNSAQWNQVIDHPALKKWNVRFHLGSGRHGEGFHVNGDNFKDARLMDASGNVLADSEKGGSANSSEGQVYYFKDDLPHLTKATLQVTLSTGYRN